MVDGSVLLKRNAAALKSLAAEDVKPLAQSFTATLTEAQRVDRLYKKYPAKLKAVGVDLKLAGSIGARIDLLIAAQTAVDERITPVTTKQEKALVLEAQALREELLAVLEWGFRDGSLDAELKHVREGTGVDDLIGDLDALRGLAAANAARLKFQKTLGKQLKRTQVVARELVDLVTDRRTTERDTDAKDLRDRAATWLGLAVREVRDAGQFAFRDDADVRALFYTPSRSGRGKPTQSEG